MGGQASQFAVANRPVVVFDLHAYHRSELNRQGRTVHEVNIDHIEVVHATHVGGLHRLCRVLAPRNGSHRADSASSQVLAVNVFLSA
jgi:hypothetical protein